MVLPAHDGLVRKIAYAMEHFAETHCCDGRAATNLFKVKGRF